MTVATGMARYQNTHARRQFTSREAGWGQSGNEMMKTFLKALIAKNTVCILSQVVPVKDLMHLLMKHRNTGEKWTKEEIREIRAHLEHIAKRVPVLVIFLLPGGSLLLPILAEVLDRLEKSPPLPHFLL
jgi:hypothetical protein